MKNMIKYATSAVLLIVALILLFSLGEVDKPYLKFLMIINSLILFAVIVGKFIKNNRS